MHIDSDMSILKAILADDKFALSVLDGVFNKYEILRKKNKVLVARIKLLESK